MSSAGAPQIVTQKSQEQEDAPPECGSISAFVSADAKITKVVNETLIADIKKRFHELDSKLTIPDTFEVVGYRTGVTLGWDFYVKVKLGGTFFQVKIHETPKEKFSVLHITETKTEKDEEEYFKGVSAVKK